MEPNDKTLLLVRWFRDRTENVVAYRDIICRKGHPQVGDTIVMPWGNEKWHGKMMQIATEDDRDDSDVDDNIPLIELRGEKIFIIT